MKQLILIPIYLLVSLLLFTSCEESNIELEPELPFDYIKFEIDGEEFLLTKMVANVYYLDSITGQDQIAITLDNSELKKSCLLSFQNLDLFHKDLPLELNKFSHPLKDGYSGISILKNIDNNESIIYNSDRDKFNGSTFDDFSIIVKSFENSILKGTFEGLLINRNGESINVTKGEFKSILEIKQTGQ